MLRYINTALLVLIVILVVADAFFSDLLLGAINDLHTIVLAIAVIASIVIELIIRKKNANNQS